MKSKETLISITFGLLGLISWYFPTIDLKLKILITIIAGGSILLIFIKDRLTYFFRKYWQELVSIGLLTSVFIVFKNAFPDLLIPAAAVILTSISISLLISFKYRQNSIYKTKVLIKTIAINGSWVLNHWQSNCASISNSKMIFTGTTAPQGTDGSHIDLIDFLEIGSIYEIVCFAKSDQNTTAKFQLWCHDKTGQINGVSEATPYKTPSTKGEDFELNFKADFNQNIRIHLQYEPGQGRIEISDVRIYKLTV